MSCPIVAELVRFTRCKLTTLTVRLMFFHLIMSLYILQGCATVKTSATALTTSTSPSLIANSTHWKEVLSRAGPSRPIADHCKSAADTTACQLFEDISSAIRFAENSPELRPSDIPLLEQAIPPLLDKQLRLSVTTYIKGDGSNLMDVLLAKRRTLSVIRWLSSHGVPLSHMQPREPVLPEHDSTDLSAPDDFRQMELKIVSR